MNIQERSVGSFFNQENNTANYYYLACVMFATFVTQRYPDNQLLNTLNETDLDAIAHLSWKGVTSIDRVSDNYVQQLVGSGVAQGGISGGRRTA